MALGDKRDTLNQDIHGELSNGCRCLFTRIIGRIQISVLLCGQQCASMTVVNYASSFFREHSLHTRKACENN